MKTLVQERNWNIHKSNPELQGRLVKALKINPIIAQILINRGISDPKNALAFLSRDINSLHDPFLLKDMDKAVSRILKALKAKEHITVYGDYDTDGICSTALLINILKELNAKCDYYLPNRMDEGYGLNKDAISKCKDNGTQLLITVDCGVSSCDEVVFANSLEMDVIITDHHNIVGTLPPAYAILNPKLPGSKYPFKDLAGVGVAYKLSQALSKKEKKINPSKHLDLVALGTIADIVPIIDENRTLTSCGLQELSNTTKKGIQKLKEITGLSGKVQSGHVAFRLAPRLNASGRMTTPEASLKTLLSTNDTEAQELCNKLENSNRQRQQTEQDVLDEALEIVERSFNFNKDKVIIIAKENWPTGVIGIVASRLVTKYHRPAIVISIQDGVGKGSGRSIRNFHLLDSLQACKDHFIKFGGHAYAAGLSIEETLIESFKKELNSYADTVLSKNDLIPQINIDAELDFKEITSEFIDEINKLIPFGYGNPKPIFASKDLEIHKDPVIVGKDHLKVWFKSKGRVFEAIGFGMGHLIDQFDEFRKIQLAYRPQINTWQNRQTIQLQIEDIKFG